MCRLFVLVLVVGASCCPVRATELHEAIQARNVTLVRSLLQADGDLVNARDSLGRTPIHWAARVEDPAILSAVIEYGADVNAADSNQVRPLHSASARGFEEHVRLLVAGGAYIDAKHARGDTPLHVAVMAGQVPTAMRLIELGADVNAVNGLQRTALMVASQQGMTGLVSTLVGSGADVKAEDSDGNAALVYAAGEGHADIVSFLLDRGADATARDWMDDGPMHAASFGGNAEIARLLVERGADIDAKNKRNTRPIHNACQEGRLEFARYLLRLDVDLGVQDSLGSTPLYLAAEHGHCELVQLLLASGADPTVANAEGILPREIAMRNSWIAVSALFNGDADYGVGSTAEAVPCGNFEELYSSRFQWTGLAISPDGRVFANYPRWSPFVINSVVELLPSGEERPYPDSAMNTWDEGVEAESHFFCVQSVVCDDSGHLWILDTGNPFLAGVRVGGAKLIQVDLSTDQIVKTYYFDSSAAPADSYLNDVRIDHNSGFAYLTDSDLGALVVLNLTTGDCRRLLDNHYSTSAEDMVLEVAGSPIIYADGTPFRVHSDGIALNPDRTYLYYQALTGRTLYRVPTKILREENLPAESVAAHVEAIVEGGACDGMIFDREGRLYLSALEHSAIKRLSPDGEIELVAQDPRICWPDSFALMPDGSVCFTTSRIHEFGRYKDEFKIYRLTPPSIRLE